jgi:hypothetical protein
MKRIVLVWMVLLAVSAGLVAQGRHQADAPDVSGVWDLAVKGHNGHGEMKATLELRQEGRSVTGSLTAHGNTHTLAGELTDDGLALETTDASGHHSIALQAKLEDDGTLAGYLSGPMGDVQWKGKKR